MEGRRAPDLFDPKPELDRNHGKKVVIDVFNGNPGPLMKSPFAFRQYGESGRLGLREVSERRAARRRHRVREVVLHRVERPRARSTR